MRWPGWGMLTGMPDSRIGLTDALELARTGDEAMGLLPPGRAPNWYDPGRFWSGDALDLLAGFALAALAALAGEIAVDLTDATGTS